MIYFWLFFRYGLECLFRFFSYGLEAKFRPELYKDFQTETLKDCEAGQLYGLEKFWAFTKYYKHADELHIQPHLKDKLEPFNTIEDFKVLYTVSHRNFSIEVARHFSRNIPLDISQTFS